MVHQAKDECTDACCIFTRCSRSSLPNAVARRTQADRQFHFYFLSGRVRHRVVRLVQVRQQSQAVMPDESTGLNAGLAPPTEWWRWTSGCIEQHGGPMRSTKTWPAPSCCSSSATSSGSTASCSTMARPATAKSALCIRMSWRSSASPADRLSQRSHRVQARGRRVRLWGATPGALPGAAPIVWPGHQRAAAPTATADGTGWQAGDRRSAAVYGADSGCRQSSRSTRAPARRHMGCFSQRCHWRSCARISAVISTPRFSCDARSPSVCTPTTQGRPCASCAYSGAPLWPSSVSMR